MRRGLVVIMALAAASAAALAAPHDASAQKAPPAAPAAAVPWDPSHKLDPGLREEVLGLAGPSRQAESERLRGVVIVVGRGGADPDAAAAANKEAVAAALAEAGARDIAAGRALSFVTARVPLGEVLGIAAHGGVYAIGDGDVHAGPAVDGARNTTYATAADLAAAAGTVPDGAGVTVSVVDDGISHDSAFAGRVAGRVLCHAAGCDPADRADVYAFIENDPDTDADDEADYGLASHGTQVAQVIAASGLPAHNGFAPGATLLDASYGRGKLDVVSDIGPLTSSLAHSLDWSVSSGADVSNLSLGFGDCLGERSIAHDLIVNEAVDLGMTAVVSAGNEGISGPDADTVLAYYGSLSSPACADNAITVGGILDSDPIVMYNASSRGPVPGTLILKPDLVAPAESIQVLDAVSGPETYAASGTSFAAPQASAVAALMLQLRPDLTPLEVKAGLLLGADWTGPVPCTSSQYEEYDPSDDCSHARQPSGYDEANGPRSLGILNNVGFGILNASGSLRHVLPQTSHVVTDVVGPGAESRQYEFEVDDASRPAKVILSWMVSPHGGIPAQANGTALAPVSDLDFVVTAPDGSEWYAESVEQVNEFAVFYPPEAGTYYIEVSAYDLGGADGGLQEFVIASTHQLSEAGGEAPDPLSSAVDPSYSAAEIADALAFAAGGGAVEFAGGTYADLGALPVPGGVVLGPAPGAEAVLSGTTSLLVQGPGVTVRGLAFEGAAGGEAIRAGATEGLLILDNTFSGYGSGVVIAGGGPVPHGGAWHGSEDVCLVGQEACPARTSGGNRTYGAHAVSSSALVAGNAFLNVSGYTVANLADGALSAKRNYHGGGATFGGVIVEPWYGDADRTEPAALGGDAAGRGAGRSVAALAEAAGGGTAGNGTAGNGTAGNGTGAGMVGNGAGAGAPPAPPAAQPGPAAPAPAPAPRPSGGGGGGGGGGSGGGGGGAGAAPAVYIASVAWDCNDGLLTIAVGPAGAAADVSVRATSGVAGAEPAGASGGLATFTAPLAPGETFVRVQASAVSGRASSSAAESVDIDGCVGRADFVAPAPRTAPAQPAPRQPAQPPAAEPAGALAGFVEPGTDPQSYVDRYGSDPAYREWFDEHYAGVTIYEAVGLPEPAASAGAPAADAGAPPPERPPAQEPAQPPGGGCLVATAAHGTELAPRVQALREARDSMVSGSPAGAALADALHRAYYALSPAVADAEREIPALRDAVRAALRPALEGASAIVL